MSGRKPISNGEMGAHDGRLVRAPQKDERLDPDALFGGGVPVELEIGCGRGAFLTAIAEMYPDRGFLGVEIAGSFARAAAERMQRRGFSNVRVLCADARRLVVESIVSRSLAAVHVFFPDPWPKKRHRKRRIFDPVFLSGVHRVLAPGGMLCFSSDFVEYFETMCAITDAHDGFERVIAYRLSGEGGVTNFERKYLLAGRASCRAVYSKRSPRPR